MVKIFIRNGSPAPKSMIAGMTFGATMKMCVGEKRDLNSTIALWYMNINRRDGLPLKTACQVTLFPMVPSRKNPPLEWIFSDDSRPQIIKILYHVTAPG